MTQRLKLTNQEFDVTELGLSNYVIALSRGINDYVALPVFLSRIACRRGS